jgi:hypothetical protein
MADLGFPHSGGEADSKMWVPGLPEAFCIFDRANDEATAALNERVATCYQWCDSVHVRCLEEYIAWGRDAFEPFPRMLTEALSRCRADGAALLVYSTAVLGQADIVHTTLAQLGDHGLWTVEGRVDGDTVPESHIDSR